MKIMDLKEKLQATIVQAAKGDGVREADMLGCDEIFKELAQESMTPQYLRHTKIARVLRQIRDMEDGQMPLEAEYKFKERAAALVGSWKHLTGVQNLTEPVDA